MASFRWSGMYVMFKGKLPILYLFMVVLRYFEVTPESSVSLYVFAQLTRLGHWEIIFNIYTLIDF